MITIIKRPGLEYASILSELGAETFVDAHKRSAPSHEVETYVKETYSVSAMRKELGDPKNIYHVIEDDQQTAGFSKLVLNCDHPSLALTHAAKMDQIYLSKLYYGTGYGASLLNLNIDYAKLHNQNGMWLIVWTGNDQAIRFYKKFGFEIVEEGKFQLTDSHVSPCYFMVLDFAKQM